MSATEPAGQPLHHHGGGHGHGHDAAPHGTRKGYLIGFILSVVLTAIPFALVMTGALSDPRWTVALVVAAAAVQIVVHMIYFLHMNASSDEGWTLLALIFTVVIVAIVIAGSLWVMYNMNTNMMSMPENTTEMGAM